MSQREKRLWGMALFEAWWETLDPLILECHFHLMHGGTSFPKFGLRVGGLQAASHLAHFLS